MADQFLKSDLEEALETLPDVVADALFKWRSSTLDREKTEALLYLQFRSSPHGEKRTAEEIKSLVRADDERYRVVLEEAKAESNYERLYERLLSKKKLADLRTAF